MSREEMKNLLQRGIYEVVFKKVDGQHRKMVCTLMPEHLPKTDVPKVNEDWTWKRPSNPNVLPVWDCDLREWRSFRIDSVLLFKSVTE